MLSERERTTRQLVEAVRRVVDSWRDGWITHDGDVDQMWQLETALRELDQAALIESVRADESGSRAVGMCVRSRELSTCPRLVVRWGW